MQLVTEITVFLENQPGTLARLTESLGEAGINIQGLTLTNALDQEERNEQEGPDPDRQRRVGQPHGDRAGLLEVHP